MRNQRKTNPKVKNGQVQKKNRNSRTINYWNTRQKELVIDIENPGAGYKHFLKKRDIHKFLELLPNWTQINIELDAVLLARGEDYTDGWYNDGVLAICAWDKNKTRSLNKSYFQDHKTIFDKLNLKYEVKSNSVLCFFNEDQIVGFQLLHIFLHELGHHHDRISTKTKIPNAPRGEEYAEQYAFKYEEIIWNKFFEVFNMV